MARKDYLSTTLTCLSIIMILLGALYIPVNNKFAAMEKTIIHIEKDHEKHCVNSKERFKKVPETKNVELKFTYIGKELTKINNELALYRTSNQNIAVTLDKILRRLP